LEAIRKSRNQILMVWRRMIKERILPLLESYIVGFIRDHR